MPYWELYCHLVWATRDRAPLLSGARAIRVENAIRAACREQGAVVHAVGMMPEHVHLAVSVPPRLAVADLARLVKGSSSHLLNHETSGPPFAWQAEYGAISFGKRSLENVVAYVRNQERHHAEDNLLPAFERIERDHPEDSAPPRRPALK
jgi:putative transposase